VGYRPPSGPPPSVGYRPPSGPQQTPMPMYAPPNSGAGRALTSRKRWLLVGGALVAVAATVAVIFLVIPKPSPPPPPPPPPKAVPTVSAAGLNSVLLSPDEINSIMGAAHMEPADVVQDMSDVSYRFSNPSCRGALYTAQKSVYADSGWSAVRDQTLVQHSSGTLSQFFVDQTAVNFGSAEQARGFLKSTTDTWQGCAGQTVTVTDRDDTTGWGLGDVTGTDPKIAQLATEEGASGWGCQHVMSTVSNVIVEVVACANENNDQASQIVDKMVGKVTQ
ncbi:MAG: sensor domain-containing protein, partial [Mycobacterium sp.]